MRKIPLFILVLIIFSSFSVSSENKIDLSKDPVAKVAMPLDKIASMKTREAEKILGRKMTLKEKLAFKITQLKLKKGLKGKAEGKSSKGQTAFILSLIGLCLVPIFFLASIPLAIIGLVMGAKAKKENPDDTKAQTAIILSIVTLGLIALAILLVVAILASGGWWY